MVGILFRGNLHNVKLEVTTEEVKPYLYNYVAKLVDKKGLVITSIAVKSVRILSVPNSVGHYVVIHNENQRYCVSNKIYLTEWLL
jgi:hypothetical protein